MRVAARLAYWGPAYHGYARQPDVDTVEADLIHALRRIRAIRDPASARLAVASRTDRGVSAVANVVAFDTVIPWARLPSATAGRMHDAWLWACVPVGPAFDPRHAVLRKYRYHFPVDLSTSSLRDAAGLFQGEHDFSSFTVGRVGGRLVIDRIRVSRDSQFAVVDFEARRFARGLLRRIAGAMEAYARGEVSEGDLRDALRGGRLRTAPVPGGGLFLLDVDCGLAWPPASDRIARAVLDRLHASQLAQRFSMEMAGCVRGDERNTASA